MKTGKADELKNYIVEEGGKFRLVSHDGKNLGTFDTREEAAKHEGQVEYFKEKSNAVSQKPNFYYVRHMQPGTCKYDKEIVLVDTEALQAMLRTGAGIPVYIHHQVGIPTEEVKERAAGYVTESFYNELDGWGWFKIMAIDDEIRLAVSNGWSVSNAYRPMQWGAGGTKNNVPYDREIVSGEFTHLAIVPNPRYEDACIMTPEEFKNYQDGKKQKLSELQNSNPNPTHSKGLAMFKFFKRDTKEVTNALDATHVEIDGKMVSVTEMVNAVKKNGADSPEPKTDEDKKMDKDLSNEMVDVQGEKMPLKELVNRYTKMNEKRNAEEKEKADKEKEEKENAEKRNAEEADKKKKEEEEAKKKAEEDKKKEDEKTNGKGYFDQLLNAHQTANSDAVQVLDTGISMTARGASRYGSGK